MCINLTRFIACVSLVVITVDNTFGKTSEKYLQCYQCLGGVACNKNDLKKVGTPLTSDNEQRGIHSLACQRDMFPNKEPYCVAIFQRGVIVDRHCAYGPKLSTFNPKNVAKCPSKAEGKDNEEAKQVCNCFADFCNGEPAGCCSLGVSKFTENLTDLKQRGSDPVPPPAPPPDK